MPMRKKYRWVMFLAVVIIGWQAGVASAATFNGLWMANDNDFFAIELTLDTNSNNGLYIYDFDEGTSDHLLLFNDGMYSSATVYFTLDASTWYAGLSSGAKTLDLGGSKDIGFYFWDGTTVYDSYDVTTLDPGEVYQLSDLNTGMTVVVSDIAPVPIPASLLLMGSGIVCLVISRRRPR